MTIDDLRRILVTCAGETDRGLNGDILDVPFDELGYDSLALLEATARIEQDYGVQIPEDRIADLEVPRQVLELVNGSTVGV